MSDFIPLDRVVYVIRPCLIGNFVISENAIDDVFYCDTTEDAQHLEERGNAFRFSNVSDYLEYSRELAAAEGLICYPVEQFINRFLNPPWGVRSPEWEEKLKVFKSGEIGDGLWWPDTIYLNESLVENPPAV